MRSSAAAPASAATTRSIRMKREPLTSTVSPPRGFARAAAPRARRRRRSARAPAPNAVARRRASVAPTAYRRVDAARARVRADLAMERRALRADLAHVAQHEHARVRGAARARRSRRAPNPGFALYAVVDDRTPPARSRSVCSRPRTARNAARPRAIGGERNAGASAAARGGERVARHVPSRHRERDARRSPCGVDSARSQPSARSATRARDVGALAPAPKSTTRAPAARAASRHTCGMRVVGVHDRATPHGGSAAIASACSARDVRDAAMNSWCSRCALLTTRDRRPRDRGELASLAAWFMPISIDGERGASSRRRSSVSGRPIALLRLPGVASTAPRRPPCARGSRDHLLHRRLAVAADDGDERQCEARPPVRARARPSAASGSVTAISACAVQRDASHRARIGDQRRRRARAQRVGDVVVAVEALALRARRRGRRARSRGCRSSRAGTSTVRAERRGLRRRARQSRVSIIAVPPLHCGERGGGLGGVGERRAARRRSW